jgi:hypothetical protein
MCFRSSSQSASPTSPHSSCAPSFHAPFARGATRPPSSTRSSGFCNHMRMSAPCFSLRASALSGSGIQGLSSIQLRSGPVNSFFMGGRGQLRRFLHCISRRTCGRRMNTPCGRADGTQTGTRARIIQKSKSHSTRGQLHTKKSNSVYA